MKNHQFIVVEGIDGSGKTNACNVIQKILKKYNIKTIMVREPGGTPIAENIRNIIKKKHKYENIHKKTILLLMYAARMQLIENIIQPSLKNNIWVISDRHDLSSYAYQGGGFKINNTLLTMLRKNILGSLRPDLTIYLDVLPGVAIQRILSRKKTDYFENKKLNFFIRTRNFYLKWIHKNNKKIFINANLKKNIVHQDIENKFIQWIEKNI
ncbi:dTMP kinase [Buchnera aphidicola]|uniref:dTMP kinase n=1 Tax=Buchnera aphidicola TaxID=9 RepID=UPI003463E779